MINNSTLIAKDILEQLSMETLPDWHRCSSVARVKNVTAGDCLFQLDEQHPYVYFVRQGIVKMVYTTLDGKEWVKEFAEEGKFFASLLALAPDGRTSFSAYAVCDTVVKQIPYQVILALSEVHPAWQKALRRGFEIYGFRKESREMELLTLSAEERYKHFVTTRTSIAGRLADRDIASYIRVTPVALSRIKRRIRQSRAFEA